MPAAIAVPAIIGAASSVGSAAIQSRAAGKAAKQQQAGADRAAAVSRQVYDDQRALMQPYTQAGQSAVTSLARLMQPGVPYTPAMQREDAQASPGAPGYARPAFGPATLGNGPGATGAARVEPRSMNVGNMGGAVRMPAQSMNVGSMGGMQFGGSGTVQLRSPDGEVRAVPTHLAQQFIARGATLVPGGAPASPFGSLGRMAQ